MTIQTILADLAERYGNEWPSKVIGELMTLALELSIEETVGISFNALVRQRYALLYDWILSTIEAGIAFQQTANMGSRLATLNIPPTPAPSCPGQGLGWCDCPPDPEETTA